MAFLIICGNIIYAEEEGNIDSVDTTSNDVKIIEINKEKLLEDIIIKSSDKKPGVSLNAANREPVLLPLGYGTPSGRILSTSQANKIAKQAGYKGAEDFKKDMLRGMKDKTISRYNMFQSNEAGSKRGNIYLHHTSTKVYYKTGYNVNNGYYPIAP